jgi:hypothetical protein
VNVVKLYRQHDGMLRDEMAAGWDAVARDESIRHGTYICIVPLSLFSCFPPLKVETPQDLDIFPVKTAGHGKPAERVTPATTPSKTPSKPSRNIQSSADTSPAPKPKTRQPLPSTPEPNTASISLPATTTPEPSVRSAVSSSVKKNSYYFTTVCIPLI